jgi:micrococcal nuclease
MKEQTKTVLIVLACVLVLAILIYLAAILLETPADNPNILNLSDNTVTRIIDGDTFQVASGDTVRLICVDTPEIGSTGSEEASSFLGSLILNKEVKLENDTDDKDAYGRLLRYVYLDDLFVNKEIVSQGYGSVFRYGNNTSKCDEIEK